MSTSDLEQCKAEDQKSVERSPKKDRARAHRDWHNKRREESWPDDGDLGPMIRWKIWGTNKWQKP